MNRFSFKGDIESVSPAQLEFITDVLEKKGFISAEVLIQPMGQAGDNYMSVVKKIDVTENGKTLKMVAKLAPESEMMRQMGNLNTIFGNEHVIYTELLPKFKELQKSADVPEEDLLRFAECYGSNCVEPYELILLENLNEKKYGMLDRFKPIPNESVKAALKQLAIYHSLAYVLKHREPQTFDAIASKLSDVFKAPPPGPYADQSEIFFKQMEESALALMTEDKHKKVLKGTTSEIFRLGSKLEGDIRSKHAIIQQGDGWTNNILFQLEDSNPAPENCIMIDYQNAKASNPAYDIIYMLFNSTSHEQRLKHYTEFIDYYHSQLDNSLNYFGLKAMFVYPRDQLDADLKRYGKFTLAICVIVSNFILRKVDDAAEVQEAMKSTNMDNTEKMLSKMIVTDNETLALYKNKVEGLVDSFLEFGLV